MSRIGFIGRGIMGAPMAGHIIDGGHELSGGPIVRSAARRGRK